jgi:hypothetical protein
MVNISADYLTHFSSLPFLTFRWMAADRTHITGVRTAYQVTERAAIAYQGTPFLIA